MATNIKETAQKAKTKVTETVTNVKGKLDAMPKKKLILMIIGMVLAIVLLSILISVLVKRDQKKSATEKLVIDNLRKGNTPLLITPQEGLPLMNQQEYMYNLWIYVAKWESGTPRCVFFRGNATTTSTDIIIQEASPSVWIYPDTNNLYIRTEVVDDPSPNYPANVQSCGGNNAATCVQKTCDVPNFPLQKWVNIGLVLYNRTLDVYINGKLARSCVISGIPKVSNGNLYVTLNGSSFTGFEGYLSRFRIYNHSVQPEEMYKLYLEGPYSGGWGAAEFKNNVLPDIPGICPEES